MASFGLKSSTAGDSDFTTMMSVKVLVANLALLLAKQTSLKLI